MADWDETNPGDSDIVSQFPGNERTARGAVKTNFGIDHEEDSTSSEIGYHKAVTLIDNAGDVAAVVNTCILYGKAVAGVTEAFLRFEGGTVLQVTENNKIRGEAVSLPIFDTGTNMVFNQAAAPTGWTQDVSVNDRVMRVVSGAGAVSGGSWTISGLSVDSHVLTIDQIPSHFHTITGRQTSSNDIGSEPAGTSGAPIGNRNTTSSGGGTGHSHGLSADGAWRPAYRDVIAATYDG